MSIKKRENQLDGSIAEIVSGSVENILDKMGIKDQNISESCVYLEPPSSLCADTAKYPVKKGTNSTEIDAKVTEGLNKFGREDIKVSAACNLNIKNLICLLQYQKCSSKGDLLPVCSSVHEEALKPCISDQHNLEEITKLVKGVIDVEGLSNSTECFSGIPRSDLPATPVEVKKTEAVKSEDTKSEETIKSPVQEEPPVVEQLWECSRYNYNINYDGSKCFENKGADTSKMPSIADLETSKIGFAFKDGMKCKDSLKLLDVQVEESCACDTKMSYIRFPCEHSLSSFGLRSKALVVSFRDVEYSAGLEKQLHFAGAEKAHSHDKAHERRQFDDDSTLNELTDPHYFSRSYYRTCNRLIGVPTSSRVDHCSRHPKLDTYESRDTQVEVYNNFKSSKLQKKFRSGCTVLDCLHHLRYLPPITPNPKSASEVFKDDGTVDTSYDICKEQISNCPEWNFSNKGISIDGYPANITSYLELDIQAHGNTNRSAIIFSFNSMATPLYEGLRFLLNGVPAMDLIHNQTDYAGYAVPLVPGKSHIARWEFIRGEGGATTSYNYADIQAIILRDASIADPEDTADLKAMDHLQNNIVHLPPKAPVRHGVVYERPGASTSLSIIPMMIILMTGACIALLGAWLWRRYRSQKDAEGDHALGSYSAPLGFAERVAQFSFPGSSSGSGGNSRYAPLGKPGSIDTPHVELNTMKMFENHLPGPNDSDSDDEPSAFDRAVSPSTNSTSSHTLQHVSPESNRNELI